MLTLELNLNQFFTVNFGDKNFKSFRHRVRIQVEIQRNPDPDLTERIKIDPDPIIKKNRIRSQPSRKNWILNSTLKKLGSYLITIIFLPLK